MNGVWNETMATVVDESPPALPLSLFVGTSKRSRDVAA